MKTQKIYLEKAEFSNNWRASLVERCLQAEMDTHLEEQRAEMQQNPPAVRNRRNGHSKKTIKGEFGEAEMIVPRDRTSEFEPILVKKGQTRFDGFDDKILALYARGMTSDIQAQLQELYGVEVSPGLISNVTDAVEEERKKSAKSPARCTLSNRLLRCHRR